jgi:phosphatidylglycerol:prolipoprotein diacylglycerol transferase
MFHFTPLPQLNLGFWQISTHGLLIAGGFLIALIFAAREAKRRGLDPEIIEGAAAIGAISGLIGARIVYIIFWGGGMSVWEMFRIWEGGLSSHGGYIFGIGAALIYFKIKKVDILAYLDAAAPYLLLGWAIGRVGCFLNWDSYGKISQSFFTVTVWGERRYPTQLFESFGYLVGFIVCRVVSRLTKIDSAKGGLAAFGLGLFAATRFAVDFFRDDPYPYFLFSQILTLAIVIASILFILKQSGKK